MIVKSWMKNEKAIRDGKIGYLELVITEVLVKHQLVQAAMEE